MRGNYSSVILALLLALAAGNAYGQFNGAIYTTLANGTTVNANLFPDRQSVYLNGGPQNLNGSGLPDGIYYFQVTDPSGGTLLSTDNAECRQVVVASGRIAGPTGPCPHAAASTVPSTGVTPVQLWPYNVTPNGGDEYKVHLISRAAGCNPIATGAVIDFDSNCAKTDNFKVRTGGGGGGGEQQPASWLLSGVKFYDGNNNGVKDTGEATLPGWTISLTIGGVTTSMLTGPGGTYGFYVDDGAVYQICEVQQAGYTQTAPTPSCYTGTANADATTLDFGNVVKVSGRKYYDYNRNGMPGADLSTEPGLAGFKVSVQACTTAACTAFTGPIDTTYSTSSNGAWSLPISAAPPTPYYMACEWLPAPPVQGTWLQTGPVPGYNNIIGGALANSIKCWVGTIGAGSAPGTMLDFGNVCAGPKGGRTLGFWSNKNGAALFDADDLAAMVALNLRNANGTAFDPATYAQFRNWILSATATNMAYMLSAQMAATKLNLLNFPGSISGSWNVAYNGGWITIDAAIAAADTLLGANGLILADSPLRAQAEALKNLFDDINNGRATLGPGVCSIVYP